MIAALAGAVATLFKINESRSAKAIEKLELAQEAMQRRFDEAQACMQCRLDESDKKHDECQEDRNALRIEMATLRERFSLNEGTADGR